MCVSLELRNGTKSLLPSSLAEAASLLMTKARFERDLKCINEMLCGRCARALNLDAACGVNKHHSKP